ncbi:unnamed protein product [Lactuca virosa]|uniref:Pentatricopeptide repeat-containing protein n=1 Tax=Lactuca virosa TaxID=75947 RepID=A0AAU9NMJ5_9ASTR|nr:unnamed protein product [Lactuca virosa]
MREYDLVPDKVSMVIIVNTCANFGAIHKSKLSNELIRTQYRSPDMILGTAMIDIYEKCGSIDTTRQVFDEMPQRNVITWSTMISAYGYQGKDRRAVELFTNMCKNKIIPNKITFLPLLYACSHSSLINEDDRFYRL